MFTGSSFLTINLLAHRQLFTLFGFFLLSSSLYSNVCLLSQPCFFSGNGRLAVALNTGNGMFIRLNKALSLPVKYWPVVSTLFSEENALSQCVLSVLCFTLLLFLTDYVVPVVTLYGGGLHYRLYK